MSERPDGRAAGELRPLTFQRRFTESPPGSVLVKQGKTVILCTATVEEGVPSFLVGSGEGWVTAEYSMLPGATGQRKPREVARGRAEGRTLEIQRLIGRSLRAVTDRTGLGPRTIWVDCDVLQADGGTRTAAITGGWLALADALDWMLEEGLISDNPLRCGLAAVSVGLVDGEPRLDLCYREDFQAAVDMNVVMTGEGRLVEVQATAEERDFSRDEFQTLIDLAGRGVKSILAAQRAAREEGR